MRNRRTGGGAPGSCGYGAVGNRKSGLKDVKGNKPYYKEAYYMATDIALDASAGAGQIGVFQNTSVRVDSDAPFELQKIMFVSTSPSIALRIRSSKGEYLMPEDTNLQTFAGTPFNNVGPGADVSWFTPYILSWPYHFAASSDIIIEAADLSGAANILRLCMWGAKIRCGIAPWHDSSRRAQPIFRSTGRQTIGDGDSQVLSLNIDSDADLFITKAQATRTGAALVGINEGARGRDWGNSSTHIDNIFGSGQFPHKVSNGRFIPVSSAITFNIQNISGADNTIEIMLEGIKYEI